ncbi:MAG: tRNA (adenosine(37)-N6)-threonylcarbamoyltransferase complex dimerization subunit type 1 TsaB [Syntrophales bacterium]|nr:tRNA (adenosine(37)-N6)-threonylcarbamoyltransferase complex dimerization subunit type 1 TsaB [Syntrophales bacterium]
MITLAIDTSSRALSLALLEGNKVVVEFFKDTGNQHGAALLPAIKDVLFHARLKVSDIDLFACTVGPGSFTGVRVGIATASGLAMASSKPVVGVSSLKALSMNCALSAMPICPMLDARRGEVYAALYRTVPGNVPELMLREQVVRPELFLEDIAGDVMFVGDGAEEYADTIRDRLNERAHFAGPAGKFIHASSVGYIGLKNMNTGGRIGNLHLAPRYLRSSYAGIEI